MSDPNSNPKPRTLLWAGVGVLVIAFIVVAVILWQRTANPFTFVSGDEQVTVILRNTKDGEYQVQYTGRQPAPLQRAIIQLESPQASLHVAVQQVTLIVGDQEVVLDAGGHVPEGTELLLQPEDTFTVRVTFYGDTIGAHYIYGFRFGYESNGVYTEETININDREFIVTVE
ncbi:MAG TPA: hypothetical protein PK530_09455 [Anaerolineales bacterium]|nr:hypothetical protein [Anaerolineales bacterium]